MPEQEMSSDHIPQVATPSKRKKALSLIIFGITIIILLSSVLFGSKKPQPKPIPTIKPNWNLVDTHAPTANPATDNLQTQLQEIHNKIDLEKLAQEEKLYHLRQSAPIEIFKASNSDIARPAAVTANTTLSTAPGLPLSASQIEKLKNYNNGLDPNSQFQQQLSNTPAETTHATKMLHMDFTVPQGTLISGVLQTAINSDLPGMVKANVSHDVFAAQGNRILIPQGSTLIGQYNSSLAMSQQRVLVVWTRLLRSDGIEVQLSSPGTDTLGEAGLTADARDTHFLARFGQASLLSIISAGISNIGSNPTDSYSSASAYRQAISGSFQQAAGASLLNTINIKPTLHVHQGDAISVFVNHDLSFFDVLNGN